MWSSNTGLVHSCKTHTCSQVIRHSQTGSDSNTIMSLLSHCPILVKGAAYYQMKDGWTWSAQRKSIGINFLVSLQPIPPAQKEMRSMQMCVVDKDLEREDAAAAVLLSIWTQHQLRLDFQFDPEGGREETNLWKHRTGTVVVMQWW